ncbi:unnamed protein product, partial [Amoebophrya sp. A25]|eukprot:GSA25T00021436001.1
MQRESLKNAEAAEAQLFAALLLVQHSRGMTRSKPGKYPSNDVSATPLRSGTPPVNNVDRFKGPFATPGLHEESSTNERTGAVTTPSSEKRTTGPRKAPAPATTTFKREQVEQLLDRFFALDFLGCEILPHEGFSSEQLLATPFAVRTRWHKVLDERLLTEDGLEYLKRAILKARGLLEEDDEAAKSSCVGEATTGNKNTCESDSTSRVDNYRSIKVAEICSLLLDDRGDIFRTKTQTCSSKDVNYAKIN